MLLSTAIWQILRTTAIYWTALCYWTATGSSIASDPPFLELSLPQRVHLYSWATMGRLWWQPHYRAPNLQQDMYANFKNLAIPGTGFPMSVFVCHWAVAAMFMACGLPLACLGAAMVQAWRQGSVEGIAQEYSRQLLSPQHWFATWRLNSMVIAMHSSVTKSQSYAMESKVRSPMSGASTCRKHLNPARVMSLQLMHTHSLRLWPVMSVPTLLTILGAHLNE